VCVRERIGVSDRERKVLKLKLRKRKTWTEILTDSGGGRPTPPAFSGEAEFRATPTCVSDTTAKLRFVMRFRRVL
jgi:hypothetical protein